MKILFTYLLLSCFALTSLSAQDTGIRYNKLIHLPSDSLIKNQLLNSINGFLKDMVLENKSSPYVEAKHFTANQFFFDELLNYSASGLFKDENFYKAHLLNAYTKDQKTYHLTIAFMGTPKEGREVFSMIFNLKAVHQGAGFLFYSYYEDNLKAMNWKQVSIGNVNYFYKNTINKNRLNAFSKFNTDFAKLLNRTPKKIDYIILEDANETFALLGIDYIISNNGDPTLRFNTSNKILAGIEKDRYEHDLIHMYFEDLFDSKNTYRSFEEGIATYFAGSWGDSYLEVVNMMKEYLNENPDADLGQLYKDNKRVGVHSIRNMINAFLCEAILKKHDFSALLDILECGNNGELYYEKLAKYTDIREANFSAKVYQLLF